MPDMAKATSRLHPAPHQGHGDERHATQTVPRRGLGTHARAVGDATNEPKRKAWFGLRETGQRLTIQHVFELVLRLKQICNFDPATGSSAKLERLVADLEEVAASGQKAIVFSQWVNSIDKMRHALARRLGRWSTTAAFPTKRDGVIDQFQNDPNATVMLMSYGAGSVGLNLQFCRYVFLFDRWWNPAVEDQAINRAHRIGVSRPRHGHADAGAQYDRRADRPVCWTKSGKCSTPSLPKPELRRRAAAQPATKSLGCLICVHPREKKSRSVSKDLRA